MWTVVTLPPLRRGLAVAALLAMGACATDPVPPRTEPQWPLAPVAYTPVSFKDLTDWGNDDHAAALATLQRSCTRLERQDPTREVGKGVVARPAADWQRACAAARTVPAGDPAAARAFFEGAFTPYRISASGDIKGLFTGYFEPELRGSRQRRGPYRTPLYRLPDDLIKTETVATTTGSRSIGRRTGDGTIAPYYTRAQIENGALAGRGLEMFWVDDPVDVFFLHIQGSGRVILDTGEIVRVNYAGQNGHSYVAVGKFLADRGAIPRDQLHYHTIRAWLRANPGEAPGIMNLNPSYVFFRINPGEGPIGAQGVPLTAGRSLAVDPQFVPLGAPVWLEAVDPLAPERPLRRLVIAQDTGGAIKGPIRGDLFWGAGEAAAQPAGYMRHKGAAVVLIPRGRGSI